MEILKIIETELAKLASSALPPKASVKIVQIMGIGERKTKNKTWRNSKAKVDQKKAAKAQEIATAYL